MLVVRFSRFAVCQMLAYSTSSTVSLAFGKIITTSKRKCARSCGVGDAVQGGGRCQKQYLSVLRGCISVHCANIQPHNLAFSVARSPTADASRRFAYCGIVVGTLPSRRLAVMSLIGNTSPPRMKPINRLQLTCVLQMYELRRTQY